MKHFALSTASDSPSMTSHCDVASQTDFPAPQPSPVTPFPTSPCLLEGPAGSALSSEEQLLMRDGAASTDGDEVVVDVLGGEGEGGRASSPPPRRNCCVFPRGYRRVDHATRSTTQPAQQDRAAVAAPERPAPAESDSEEEEEDASMEDVNAVSAELYAITASTHEWYARGLLCDAEGLAQLPQLMAATHPILSAEDVRLERLSMPLLDHVFSASVASSAFARMGTCVVAVPLAVARTSDPYLQRIPQWLREGVDSGRRPVLNCNYGLQGRERWMAFYQSHRGSLSVTDDGLRHYTLWARAAQYDWSTLLVQPTFMREQCSYEMAEGASEDIGQLMRGYEASHQDRANRLMLITHCDGWVQDGREEEGVRSVERMVYFEHMFLFPEPAHMGWSEAHSMRNVDAARLSSWSHFCNPHFHFPVEDATAAPPGGTACRSVLLPALPGITTPMVYVSAGYTVFPWHKEDLALKSAFCVLDGAPKLLFTVPVEHERAFSCFMRSRAPPDAHPLFHRSKSAIIIPGADLLQRFHIAVRLCHVGQAVVIAGNVWHCGINLGANSSISVNIVGAGGVEEFVSDLRGAVNDLHDMHAIMADFKAARVEDGRDDGVCRKRWLAALKLLSGQVLIYNRQRAEALERPPASRARAPAHPVSAVCASRCVRRQGSATATTTGRSIRWRTRSSSRRYACPAHPLQLMRSSALRCPFRYRRWKR